MLAAKVRLLRPLRTWLQNRSESRRRLDPPDDDSTTKPQRARDKKTAKKDGWTTVKLQTALHHAISKEDGQALRRALEMGASAKDPLPNGNLPLIEAVQTKNVEVMATLLEHGASPLEGDPPPVFIASFYNDSGPLRLLLQEGGHGKTMLASGETAMSAAAFSGRVDNLEALAVAGGDVNCTAFHEGMTPLHAALAEEPHADVVRWLIVKGADVDAVLREGQSKDTFTPLMLASMNGCVESIAYLLDHEANVNAFGQLSHQTALHLAVKKGHLDAVVLLLTHKAHVNVRDKKGCTPLILCTKHSPRSADDARNTFLIMEALLDAGAMLHYKDSEHQRTALHWLAITGKDSFPFSVSAAKYLLLTIAERAKRKEGDVYEGIYTILNQRTLERLTPVALAIHSNFIALLRLLLDAGAEYNKPVGGAGATPLHIAATYGREEAARLLLKKGHDPNTTGECNVPPLTLAVWQGFDGVAKVLLEHGADVLSLSRQTTPFEEAIRTNACGILELMLDVRPSLATEWIKDGKKDDIQKTGLHIAAEAGATEAFELLLKRGADLRKETADGSNALALAVSLSNIDIVRKIVDRDRSLIYSNPQRIRAATPVHLRRTSSLLVGGDRDTAAHNHEHDNLQADHVIRSGSLKQFHSNHNGFLDSEKGNTNGESVRRHTGGESSEIEEEANCGTVSPLEAAAKMGRVDMLRLLLFEGADINEGGRGTERTPPLFAALANGQEEAAQYLLRKGADPRKIGRDGATALHCAAMGGSVVLARELMSWFRGKVDVEDDFKTTPLMIAAAQNQVDMVQFLLSEGADPSRADNDGDTAEKAATKFGAKEALHLLQETKKSRRRSERKRSEVL